MSQWTHVCGCIRVDAARELGIGETPDQLKDILGEIVKFGEYKETTLPCGSEGSLKYEILENPNKSSMAAYTIPIWGDLRCYDDVEEIKRWFNGVCERFMMVRDAVLSIDVEFRDKVTITYKKKDEL